MKHLLLWEGNCSFCAYCADWLRALDKKQLFEIIPHQRKRDDFLLQNGLSRGDCEAKIQLITNRGEVLGGADAFNFFLENYAPWSLIIRILRRLPPLLALEKRIYAVISLNRPLVGRWLKLDKHSDVPFDQ